ncbi:hypothetical protein PG994_001398 [Apiospora phragmitis]|uniref:Uncharacterized protein n=1 Tax=Apiospora phragmitis TaxID=2905665 RepID=A0ABR1WTF1_9PEZI
MFLSVRNLLLVIQANFCNPWVDFRHQFARKVTHPVHDEPFGPLADVPAIRHIGRQSTVDILSQVDDPAIQYASPLSERHDRLRDTPDSVSQGTLRVYRLSDTAVTDNIAGYFIAFDSGRALPLFEEGLDSLSVTLGNHFVLLQCRNTVGTRQWTKLEVGN